MAENTNIFQRALAEILGLPVDLTNSAITGVLKAVGLPEYVIEDPVGGRAWLMENTGITTDDLQAAAVQIFEENMAFGTAAFTAVMDAKSRFMERVKQGYSDMLIPDEEIASKQLNKGHVGSGWLPEFVENASIMWNRELMRASKTPYASDWVDDEEIKPLFPQDSSVMNIDLQTTDFKKSVAKVPEETNLLDYFIQTANAPTDVPVDYEDALKMYDIATDADAFPRSIKAAQEINSVYYWDGDGEKQIALYKEQLDHFKETSAYSPTVDESALTQAANWMESVAITGMNIDFDEIGGSTTNQVTNAWDNFKAAKTLEEATAALDTVTKVSTAQPSEDVGTLEKLGLGIGKFYSDLWDGSAVKKGIETVGTQFMPGVASTPTEELNQVALDSVAQPSLDFQFDDILDPHKYTTAGDRFSGLSSVYETDDSVPAGAHPSGLPSLDEIPQVIGTFPNTNEGATQANEMVRVLETQGIEATVNPPTTESGVYSVTETSVVPAEEQSWWDSFKDSLTGPTKLGESAYADTMIRDQMAYDMIQDQKKNTALMGTGPTMNIGELPLSTWEDTPFAYDAGDTSGANQHILNQLTEPMTWTGWQDNFPDDLPESDLFPPADTRDLGGRLSAGPQENIFVGLQEDEQNALMTDNSLMTDYLAAREKIKPYQYPEYYTGGPKFEHEDYYPGSQAAANAAGFNFLGATPFNPAYNEYKDAQRMLMGIAPGAMFNSEDWIGTFGPKGVANAANINAMTGMLQDEYFSSDDPSSGGMIGGGVSVGSGIGEPPSGA